MPNSTRRLTRTAAAWCLAVAGLLSFDHQPATAQVPQLVKDIVSGAVDAQFSPIWPAKLAGHIVLKGCTPDLGCELWSTDGSSLGTNLVKDIDPGPRGSLQFFNDSAKLGGRLYFAANDGVRGQEVWSTDGTPAGTSLLIDIFPGVTGSAPSEFYSDGSLLYFAAIDPVEGREAWVSDGTSAGTERLTTMADAHPLSGAPGQFLSNGSLVFFAGVSGPDEVELFATDGTPGSVYQVADINAGPSGSGPRGFQALGSLVIFSASDGLNGRELWKSDGTSLGTQRLADIRPSGSSLPTFLGVVGTSVLFTADNGTDGRELWKTDGTTTGMLKDIHPSGSGVSSVDAAMHGGQLYFRADDGTNGAELWRSDGTVSGTMLAADINPLDSSNPQGLVEFDGRLYFGADDGTHGEELWAFGSSAQLVSDLDGTSDDSLDGINLFGSGISGGLFVFRATLTGLPNELWSTDGTDVSTNRITNVTGEESSAPQALTPWQGGIAFHAKLPSSDGEREALYESDGTDSGTMAVDIWPTTSIDSNIAGSIVPWDGKLFIMNHDSEAGEVDLWTWDGASALEIASNFGTSLFFGPEDFQPATNALVFRQSATLHATDGSAVGAAENTEIAGVPSLCASGADTAYTVFGDLLVYSAPLGGDCELWTTDLVGGVSALLVDIDGADSSTPEIVGTFDGKVILRLTSGSKQGELWASDGTASGTTHLHTFPNTGIGPLGIQGASVGTGLLFIQRDEVTNAYELWTTQGTTASTSLVASLPTGVFRILAGTNDGMYFHSEGNLWFSDGTGAGTLILDSGFSEFDTPTVYDQKLIFAGTNLLDEGPELFIADSSDGVVQKLSDIEPGLAGTSAEDMLVLGDTLYVSAYRSDVGTELFKIDLISYLSVLFADGFETGDATGWSSTSP